MNKVFPLLALVLAARVSPAQVTDIVFSASSPITFTNLQGKSFNGVTLVKATLDGIVWRSEVSGGMVSLTNLAPDLLESWGVSSNRIELAAVRAQRKAAANAAYREMVAAESSASLAAKNSGNAADLRVIGGKVYDVRHRGKNEDWLLSGASASGYVHEFKCSRVLADGLLVEGEGAYYGDIPEAQGKVVEVPLFFLTNYPHFDQVTEGEKLRVVALRTGSYTFKDATGQLRRIKTYDCGTPLKPRSY